MKRISILLLLSTAGVVTLAKDRIMTMRNLCSKPVWFGFAGGSVRSRNSQDTRCNGDGDCYEGTKCIKTGNINQCFFINPRPADGNFKLETNTQKDVPIPITGESFDLIWSGAITGKSGCDDKG